MNDFDRAITAAYQRAPQWRRDQFDAWLRDWMAAQACRNGPVADAGAEVGLGDRRTKSKNHTGVITDRGRWYEH
jgi:hypothetical protein